MRTGADARHAEGMRTGATVRARTVAWLLGAAQGRPRLGGAGGGAAAAAAAAAGSGWRVHEKLPLPKMHEWLLEKLLCP
jgi:hypothetical protein